MNKIINWVFGSFFRTLGRIFVYILLGLVLSYLLKDVKIPKINLWEILDVSADVNIGSGNNNNFITANDIQFFNNSGGTLSQVSGSFGQTIETIYVSNSINFNSNGYGAVVGFNVNGGLLQDYLYSVSLYIGHGNNDDTSYPKISNYYKNTGVMIGNSMSDILNNWNAGAFWVSDVIYSNDIGRLENIRYYVGTNSSYLYKTGVITYIFKSNANAQYLGIPFNFSQSLTKNVYFYGYSIENLGKFDVATNSSINNAINNSGLASASSVSQVQSSVNQVQSDLNSSTNTIVNNQNQTKQEIINNANENSQAEIQNANANTDKTIDSQKVCSKIDKTNIIINNKYLERSGTLYEDISYGVTDYIKINSSTITPTVKDPYAYYCFYNINKSLISCNSNNSLILNENITIPNNASYVRFSIHKGYNQPQFEICTNGNQAIGDSLNDMNDYITDDTAPSSDISSLGTVQGLLPPGPVDSLLNIPVAFLSVITSSMSGTCTPLQGDFVYGSTLSIPCFGEMIYDNNSIPPVLMLFINVIPSAFILIEYFKHLYKKVDRAVSMDATADDDWGVI